ncbi:MAG TPA: cysteine desulfurase family protein [Patescibacteria group bacterium]|nr:cysteine desulfurase family protein [Patescibacteria group bacterium]
MSAKTIYLDYAAATPMDDAVFQVMKPYFADKFYNPSANYLAAKAVKDEITEAEKIIAAELGVKHSEIIHTSGGTESNNLAIRGVMDLFPDKKMLVSSVEHDSVLKPASEYKTELIPADQTGMVNIERLEKMIDADTVLISVMLANNEVGTIQPIAKIAELVSCIRKDRQKNKLNLPLYLHTDACQAPCYIDVKANRLGADMMTLNSGKIYGSKGSGILFLKSNIALTPQILGGGQQRRLRSGTENPAGIIGFAKALQISAENRIGEYERVSQLRQRFIDGLQKMNPKIKINENSKKHMPHIVHATFVGQDNETLVYKLDEAGIMAASGSACSASSDEPSHVLAAMGISDEDARSSLRFSFGRQTSTKDIDHTLGCLSALLA